MHLSGSKHAWARDKIAINLIVAPYPPYRCLAAVLPRKSIRPRANEHFAHRLATTLHYTTAYLHLIRSFIIIDFLISSRAII